MMSKKISLDRARELYNKDLELQQLQREGKPLPKSNRRTKKYLLQVRKQEGFIKYLIARYKKHGHQKEVERLEKTLK